jgi:hypothetical protein
MFAMDSLGRCMTLHWSHFYSTLDLNELSIFNDFITNLFDELVLFRARRCVDSDTPWFDSFVGSAVLEFDIANRFWKVNRN